MAETLTPPTAPAIIEIRPQPGPQEAFLSTSADIAILGGAAGGGKSWGLLLEPLRHIDNPGFGAVTFRRTSPQITNEGGLWDESSKLYPLVGGKPYNTQPPFWKFPSGVTLSFSHLQHEKSVYDWQGSQITLICFDELTHFTEKQFFYMLSRNRSTCGVRPYVRATTNPDASSWVAKFISWWIDQDTGYPIHERSGVLRWFYRVNEVIHWYDTKEEARAAHPEHAEQADPKSVTFIAATIEDNRILLENDPSYKANLLSLSLVERERLLKGNWKIMGAAGTIFQRAWFGVPVKAAPEKMTVVRYWDKAGTEGGSGAETAGVLMGRSDGRFYILDVVHGRWSAHNRNIIMQQTAIKDAKKYRDYFIFIEQEPGSGGKESAEESVRLLSKYAVGLDRVTGDKVTRAMPLSAQVEAGNVDLLESGSENDWNEPFLLQAENFPIGLKDMIDAASGAYNKLQEIL